MIPMLIVNDLLGFLAMEQKAIPSMPNSIQSPKPFNPLNILFRKGVGLMLDFKAYNSNI